MPRATSFLLALTISVVAPQQRGLATNCASCHPKIATSYAETGMARSFSRVAPGGNGADFRESNSFTHEASGRSYQALRRGDRFFLRRWQQDEAGQVYNVVEKEAHFALGSGNHAVSFLHQTPDGRLLQMPLSWYSADGGYWAMAPGYDRPDHADFRRAIDLECIFCHNAYPSLDQQEIPDTVVRFPAQMPEGIDCTRCHGPATGHADAASRGDAVAARATVTNPSRLSRERELEVCMQCHLETTTDLLPHAIRRSGRGFYSYDPAEPLADYVLHFDHAEEADRGDKFEVVSAAYRLRASSCFQRSEMVCTTCHDPHHIERGEVGKARYNAICRDCHDGPKGGRGSHAGDGDCVGCHMPQRPAEDARHVRMTDHRILARPNLPSGADGVETGGVYRGAVELYYPIRLPRGDSALDLALAQVRDFSNLSVGLRALERAIRKHEPPDPRYAYFLGEGLRQVGREADALKAYNAALSADTNFWPATQSLGLMFAAGGDLSSAVGSLEQAFRASGGDVSVAVALGDVYYRLGRRVDAIDVLRQGLADNPESPEAHSNLGVVYAATGDLAASEGHLREAIRHRPDYAPAQANLAGLLLSTGRAREAVVVYERAIALGEDGQAVAIGYQTALAAAK